MPAPPGSRTQPRTLLLVVDAVPVRVARQAALAGAFEGWSGPAALVAPFPTVTHVGFASLFAPFGVPPSDGYEIRYFDRAANRCVGAAPLTYRRDVPPWGELLDSPHRSLVTKTANYVSPRGAARLELDEVERDLLDTDLDPLVAYIGATDGMLHLADDAAAVAYLQGLDDRLVDLRARHLARRGRPLRVVLLSDHGCGREKIHHAEGLPRLLRAAGLRPVTHLERPDDVVLPEFGLINMAVLFLADPARGHAAARAVAEHPAVDLAAWAPAPDRVEVVGRAGTCCLRWRVEDGVVLLAAHDRDGDVLRLAEARASLAAAGALDDAGYARDADWFAATAQAAYPDPLRRLVDALTGDRIRNRADVLVSLGPSWAVGWRSAVVGAAVRGGRLEGTHGGLDRESTLGLLAVSDRDRPLPPALRSQDALAPYAPSRRRPGTARLGRCDGARAWPTARAAGRPTGWASAAATRPDAAPAPAMPANRRPGSR